MVWYELRSTLGNFFFPWKLLYQSQFKARIIEVRHRNESVNFYKKKSSNVIAENYIGNFAILLDPRMSFVFIRNLSNQSWNPIPLEPRIHNRNSSVEEFHFSFFGRILYHEIRKKVWTMLFNIWLLLSWM